jgi:hypothetical protein
MKSRIFLIAFGIVTLLCPAWAQQPAPQPSPLPIPAPLEKELAARASRVTEVTLDKNMLGYAGTVMNGQDGDQSYAKKFIGGLDGIYVRQYEFDKDGQYSMDDIEKLRQAFETPDWTPIIRTRERDDTRISEVLVKQVNGETRGMFLLTVEPRELSIVLILGPVRMDQLGMLGGFGVRGLGRIGALGSSMRNFSPPPPRLKLEAKPPDGNQQ